MEKQWSAVCALILAFGAFVHLNTVAAAETDRNLTGKFALTVCLMYDLLNLLFPSEKCMFVCLLNCLATTHLHQV